MRVDLICYDIEHVNVVGTDRRFAPARNLRCRVVAMRRNGDGSFAGVFDQVRKSSNEPEALLQPGGPGAADFSHTFVRGEISAKDLHYGTKSRIDPISMTERQ